LNLLSLLLVLFVTGSATALVVTTSETVQTAGPGNSVTFKFSITNNEATPVDVRLETAEEFVHEFSSEEFRLNPGETVEVQFHLSIPEDALAERHESPISVMEEQVVDPRTGWVEAESFTLFTDIEVLSTEFAGSDSSLLWLSILGAIAGAGLLLYRWRKALVPYLPVWLARFAIGKPDVKSSFRRQLLEVVGEEPGIGTIELSRFTDRDRTTIYYHLKKLKARGNLKNGPTGGWYLQEFEGPFLKTKQKKILAGIKANKALSLREMGKQLEMSPSTLHYHLKRLEELGLLPASRGGRVKVQQGSE
jgi:DNA-binding MarR family transcriptional regulator